MTLLGGSLDIWNKILQSNAVSCIRFLSVQTEIEGLSADVPDGCLKPQLWLKYFNHVIYVENKHKLSLCVDAEIVSAKD